MSMNKEMQDSFAMFYGMSQSLKGVVEPVEMEDDERVSKAKQVFLNNHPARKRNSPPSPNCNLTRNLEITSSPL